MTPQDSKAVDLAVRNLVAAIRAKEYVKARSFIKVTSTSLKVTPALQYFEDSLKKSGNAYEIRSISSQQKGSKFTISLSTRIATREDGMISETIFAEKVGRKIMFLPKLPKEKPAITAYWISLLDNDPGGLVDKDLKEAKLARFTELAKGIGEQLSFCLDIYLADFDGQYPAKDWKWALARYRPNDEVLGFTNDGKRYDYAFNENLYKVSRKKVKKASETVLFYVGKPDQLNYMLDGSTVVVYVDGHARVISKEQSKKLIWTP